MKAAKELLFRTVAPDGSGQPLFPSMSGLIQELAHAPEYADKKGLASFLSQIFKGSRSCPKALHDAILLAVDRRLSATPAEIRQSWVDHVSSTLTPDPDIEDDVLSLNAEKLYYDIQMLASTAGEQFIITAKPAELIPSSRAEILTDILLIRFGLVPQRANKKQQWAATTAKQPHYRFFVDSIEAAQQFWKAIVNQIVERAAKSGQRVDVEGVKRRLQQLHREECLLVHVASPLMCGIPVVVFDPGDKDHSTGFTLFYHPGNANKAGPVSVARMDPEYLNVWRNLIYVPYNISAPGFEKRVVSPDFLLEDANDRSNSS
jgi:hypothetical protein